jgi:hypothetical protein
MNREQNLKAPVTRNHNTLLKYLTIAIYILCLSICPLVRSSSEQTQLSKSPRIDISVDPRVELIAIVFRLAGNPEYNDGTLRPYVKAIERHFGDFDNHPVIKMAAELRLKRSMSCDGPMSLAVHIDHNFRLKETPEEWPSTLDYRWEKKETAEFLEKLRQFSAETKFDEFFKAQSSIYETGMRSCKDLMTPLNLGDWLSGFFGVKDYGDLKLVLGFVNGFSNYGPRFKSGRIAEKYAIVGMRPFDAANTVIFRPSQVGTTVHEFCHSFANPVVEKYMEQLRPAGEKLFAANGPAMRMRGYQKWESLMYETAVRACVMSFVREKLEPMYLGYFLEYEVKAGFNWIEEMGNFLKNYENNRDKYPTFESFFPEFVTFINEYAGKVEL